MAEPAKINLTTVKRGDTYIVDFFFSDTDGTKDISAVTIDAQARREMDGGLWFDLKPVKVNATQGHFRIYLTHDETRAITESPPGSFSGLFDVQFSWVSEGETYVATIIAGSISVSKDVTQPTSLQVSGTSAIKPPSSQQTNIQYSLNPGSPGYSDVVTAEELTPNQYSLDASLGLANVNATNESVAAADRAKKSAAAALASEQAAKQSETIASNKAAEALTSQTEAKKSEISSTASAKSCAADAVQTADDRTKTTADAAQTANDRIQTTADAVQTRADRIQTTADAAQTNADRIQTTTDAATASNAATQSSKDAAQTTADRVQTTADATQTNADVVTVNAAKIATEKAAQEATQAFDAFDDKYLGAKQTPPTTDNDGDPLKVGTSYWNEPDQLLYYWNGAAWESPDKSVSASAKAAQASAAAALQSEGNALASATTATSDAAKTAADRVKTTSDAAQTASDRVKTTSDAAQTAADRTQTGKDVITTNSARDAALLAEQNAGISKDAALQSQNKAKTSEDAASVDAAKTAADRVQTGNDVVQTTADRAKTTADAAQTAADRVQTGKDVVAANAAKTAAAQSAQNAANSETEVENDKNTVVTAKADFDKKYLGEMVALPSTAGLTNGALVSLLGSGLYLLSGGKWEAAITDNKAAHLDVFNTFTQQLKVESGTPHIFIHGTGYAAPILELKNSAPAGKRNRIQGDTDGSLGFYNASNTAENWTKPLSIKDNTVFSSNLRNTGRITALDCDMVQVNGPSTGFPRLELHWPGVVASQWVQHRVESRISQSSGSGAEINYIAAFRNTNRTVQFAAAAYAANGFQTGSDRRLKKGIKVYEPTESALTKVMNLQAKNYRYRQESEEVEQRLGFIAQEADLVCPEAVRESNPDYKGEDGESENYLTVDPMAFIALQNEAIKELAETVNKLEKRLTDLESK